MIINENRLSQEEKFVLLYLQTIELVQIYIDIYNNFERVCLIFFVYIGEGLIILGN